jgi:hypothetical protein
LVVHSLIILSVILSIECIDLIIRTLMHDQEWIFFKGAPFFQFPARWLFDAADISMLGVLMYRGTIIVYHVYKHKSSGHV